ncbi:MAG: hypothetical protein H0W46_13125, partial [Acidimicrobiia bacterium]|nr:hypothetical protein [Acidimicrobiia bacterium]
MFSGAVLGESAVLNLGVVTIGETNCEVGAPDGATSTTTPGGGTLPPTGAGNGAVAWGALAALLAG